MAAEYPVAEIALFWMLGMARRQGIRNLHRSTKWWPKTWYHLNYALPPLWPSC